MKLKEITFIFENCEYVTIDGYYVGDFVVDQINTSIRRIATNSISPISYAKQFIIEIHKDGNCHCELWGDSFFAFDRLRKYRDIVRIEFVLVDDNNNQTKYEYNLDWGGDSDYTNVYQDDYLSKFGNLYIVVSQNETVEHYFSYDVIDNKMLMEFRFDMYHIGGKPLNGI